jgi:solute carrier family 25 aspartate/glutamate transporter 12/13
MATNPTVVKVKETVKESLLGVETPQQLYVSAETKATFLKHARQDGDSEDLIMGEEEFINAIAPSNEDYVSFQSIFSGLYFRPPANV